MADQASPTDDTVAERERLQALRRYDVLDTPAEEAFDRITRLARATMGAPVAFVSLIDEDRQWLKSRLGELPIEIRREDSFCAHTITQQEPLIVDDATADARFRDNPLVVCDDGIRFYLGVPLRTPDGHNIGALCVVDYKPRTAKPEQVALMEDLARLVVDQFELRGLARSDTLTGALTRRAFRAESAREFERARRHELPLSLVLFDVDHFKHVNDAFGHQVGDRVLTAIAEIARAEMRVNDLFSRLGGEEFALLMPDTTLDGALALAERLRTRIAQRSVTHAGQTARVTASFGVTTLRWNDGSISHMVKRADMALFDAKTSGRNRVVGAPAERTSLPLAG